MRWRLFKIVLTLFSFCNAFAYSQTEDEMKNSADKYFSEGKYLEATSLYMRLLSLKPDDYNLNYRYGTCLLFNSNKKQDAAKYLNYSIKNPNATAENHYFLGKALQYSYLFGDAIKEYNIYLQNRAAPESQFPVERDLEMCQNGKRLLSSVTDLIVLDKKEITTDKFFRIYDLKDIGGSLIVTSDFQTKLDKKNNHLPLIHFPQNPSMVFYSSYGENGETGKDIYFRKKQADGTWSEAKRVEGKINTNYDEDYPYLNPSGQYLYFSSKGHNSMGGFDVFRSKFDDVNGIFGTPENLDFAISSPDDDVLFIVDSLDQNAYFASARQSELGKLHVYKVMMERVPLQMVVLKGSFVSDKIPSNKQISIEVSDALGNKTIGNFNSDESGNYTITLPKGGNYEYVMKIEGNNQEFRSQIKIPITEGFKPYKQVIKHLDENNLEVVKVINLFDEIVEDQQELLAEIIKKRSTLDVNVNEFDLNKIANQKADRAVLSDLGLANLSLNEVVDVLEQQGVKNDQNNALAKNIANNVNNLVVENKVEFLRLEEEIKDKVASANNLTNPDEKYKKLKEAENLINTQKELKKYSDDLLRLSDSVSKVLSSGLSLEEQKNLGEITTRYKELYNEGNEKDALTVLSENKALIQKILGNTSGNIVQNLVDKSVQIDEINVLNESKISRYKEDISALKVEITKLEATLQDAKKKDIPSIENQLASKSKEIELIESEIRLLQKSIDAKAVEKFKIDQQINLLQDAISNKSLVEVTRSMANKAISETEKTNTNTLIAYVEQQVKILEDEDPTRKERINVTNGLTADELFKQYVANNQGITDDPNFNKETKLFKQLTVDRATMKQLDDRLSEINKMIAQGKGNDVLNKEKTTIEAYKEQIKQSQNERELAVASILSKQGVGDKESVINAIDADYLGNKSFIEKNSNLTNIEKNIELNKEDEALLLAIEAELKKVDAALINSPNDQVLLIKQNSLIEIKAALEKEIESRKNESTENFVASETKESLLNTIDKEYSNKIVAINNSSDQQQDKKDALNELDKELIKKIENEISSLNNDLKNNANSAELQNKKKLLAELKSEKEVAIEQRNTSNSSESTSLLTSEKVVNQLSPDYEENINTINSNNQLGDSEKRIALNTEDENLIKKIEVQLEKVEKNLSKNTSDELLTKEKAILQDLKKEKQELIQSRNKVGESQIEDIVSALPNYNLNGAKIELINRINPGYIDEVKAAERTNASVQEKAKILINKDAAFLEDLKEAKQNVNKQLQSNPNSTDFREELNLIESLESDAVGRMLYNNKLLAAKTQNEIVSNEEVNLKRGELLKNENQNIELIKANNNKTAIEKQEEILNEKKAGLNLVKTELDLLSEKISTDPQNKSQQKDFDIINTLKNELELEITTDENELQKLKEKSVSNVEINNNNLLSELKEESLSKTLMPEYQLNKTKIIQDANLSDVEKNAALLALENSYNSKLKAEEINVVAQLDKNADDKNAKDKLALLEAMVLTSDNELIQLKTFENNELNGNTSEENTSQLINRLVPDYQVRKATLENSKMEETKKLEQLYNLEKSLQDDLTIALSEVEKQLQKNPNDQLKIKEKESISNAIASHKKEAEEYNNRLNTLKELADKEYLLSTIDKTFKSDIEVLNANFKENRDVLLLNREEELQNNLTVQISDNNKRLENKDDPDLVRENRLLNELILESEERVQELQNYQLNSTKKLDFINEIRPNNLKSIDTLDARSIEELQSVQKELDFYGEELNKLINEKPNAINVNPDNQEIRSEIIWLNEERDWITMNQQKLQNAIGSLENLSSIKTENKEYDDIKITELVEREKQIQSELENASLDKKEQKVLLSELEEVQQNKSIRIGEIIKSEITEEIEKNQILKNQLEKSQNYAITNEIKTIERKEEKSQELINLASKAKTNEEKNNLLKQAYVEQVKVNDILLNAAINEKINEVETNLPISILSKSEKEAELNVLKLQRNNLNVQIENLEAEKGTAKKRDLATIEIDLQDKKNEQNSLDRKIESLQNEIEEINRKELKSTLVAESKEVNVDFNEEVKIAQTKEYKSYYTALNNALAKENEARKIENELNTLRAQIKMELINSVIQPNDLEDETINRKKDSLISKIKELELVQSDLVALQESAKTYLSTENLTALQMQNMVYRGVVPIDVQKIAVQEMNLPTSGIVIDTNSGSKLSILKTIPLDLKTPSGLVYRVQVGAFAKPIKQDLFKEFAPVTTEKIPNTNITRYLAGYFSSSEKALSARDQIRTLGYTDAFIIAYCDGVRITIAEAKELEASGACVPKQDDELALEVAENAVKQMGLDTASLLEKVDEYDYNKAVGAAAAEAAEKHLGLFYTVQVGVFLHPVNAAMVREMAPLMTERLSNGTIRYSVGVYHSVDEARLTKQQAIDKGISDAFITAYYKGKRISVKEAENLIALNGLKILEPLESIKSGTLSEAVQVDTTSSIENIISYNDKVEIETVKTSSKIYQIVTKKQFNEFPRDVLNRYNMKGNFYFDEKEGKVKSNLMIGVEEIPSVYYFKDDIDTLIFEDSSALNLSHFKVVFEKEIPGDVMDWLNKINVRKEYFWKENGVEICIFDTDENQSKNIENQIKIFGLLYEFIVPEEVE